MLLLWSVGLALYHMRTLWCSRLMPRYIKWDYDRNEATEYERVGECNYCGQCCKMVQQYRRYGHLTKGAIGIMGDRTDKVGVWSEYRENGQGRLISLPFITGEEHPCVMLKDNKCIIHTTFTMDNLTLCKAWPVIPEHVKELDQCSYTFVERKKWKIK